VLSLTNEKKELSEQEQRKLNKQLRGVVKVFIEKSEQGLINQHYFEKVRDLINQGAKCRISKEFVEYMFRYKFIDSCRHANDHRCGIKPSYKHVKYCLGDKETAFERLKENRNDLYKSGLEIVKKFLEDSMKIGAMSFPFAPVIHRMNDEGDYDWDNIQILPRYEHMKLTKKQHYLIKFSNTGINIFKLCTRSLIQKANISEFEISNYTGKTTVLDNHEKTILFDNKTLKDIKRPIKEKLKEYKKSMKEHAESSVEYILYNFLYEHLYSIALNLDLIKKKVE
jgi:hypothetical protein